MTPVTQTLSDPYQEWLGIPPGPRPPDHYTLLGLPRFEANPDRVREAVRERIKLVRPRCLRFPEEGTRLLNEITTAEVCLLDPQRVADYNRTFRDTKVVPAAETAPEIIPFRKEEPTPDEALPVAAPPKTIPIPAERPHEPRRPATAQERQEPRRPQPARRPAEERPAKRPRAALAGAALLAVAALVAIGVISFVMSGRRDAPTADNQVAEGSPHEPAPGDGAGDATNPPATLTEPEPAKPADPPAPADGGTRESKPPETPTPMPGEPSSKSTAPMARPPTPAPTVSSLVRDLRDGTLIEQRSAAEQLAKIGARTPELAVPALAAAMEEDDQALAEAVRRSLVELAGRDVSRLRDLVRGRHAKARSWAVQMLKEMGPEASPALLDLLVAFGNGDADLRIAIIECVQATQSSDETGLQMVGDALKDISPRVRKAALAAVAQFEPEAAARTLSSALAGAKDDVALAILDTLAQMGAKGQGASSAVQGLMNDAAPPVRLKAALAYAKIVPERAPTAAAAILHLLRHPSIEVGKGTAQALGQMGVRTNLVLLGLAAALRDGDREVRVASAVALRQLKPQNAQIDDKMIEALREVDLHDELVPLLAERGPEVLRKIITAVGHPSDFVRLGAAKILARMGEGAREAYPTLRTQYGKERSDVVKDSIWSAMLVIPSKPAK